jgi:hypothetical protein
VVRVHEIVELTEVAAADVVDRIACHLPLEPIGGG